MLLLAVATPGAAQRTQLLLMGRVADSTTARPLAGALVVVGGTRATRTDENGEYAIALPRSGEHVVEVRRVGYAPGRLTIQVAPTDDRVFADIALQRLATLDTVRVIGAARAVHGVVANARTLTPLADASVELLGAGHADTTGDDGRFFIPFKTGTTFLVRAKSKGHAPQMISIVVPPDSGLEISMLLDSSTADYPRRLEMAFAAFDQRSRWRSFASAIIPRSELLTSPTRRCTSRSVPHRHSSRRRSRWARPSACSSRGCRGPACR